jgi:transposase-like protein
MSKPKTRPRYSPEVRERAVRTSMQPGPSHASRHTHCRVAASFNPHYDNAGDWNSLDDGQTAWETRFTSLGLRGRIAPDTELLVQAMTGQTVSVSTLNLPISYVDDVEFRSAYALVDRVFGKQGLALRADRFETEDNQAYNIVSTPERGWAWTAAWRMRMHEKLSVLGEVVHVESERPARAEAGIEPKQAQTSLQVSLRASF